MNKQEKKKLLKKIRFIMKWVLLDVAILLFISYFVLQIHNDKLQQAFKIGVHHGFKLGSSSACRGA